MDITEPEHVSVSKSLRQLEDAALLLDEASKARDPKKLSVQFPNRLNALVNSLTALVSRDDAERLLSVGSFMPCNITLITHLHMIIYY